MAIAASRAPMTANAAPEALARRPQDHEPRTGRARTRRPSSTGARCARHRAQRAVPSATCSPRAAAPRTPGSVWRRRRSRRRRPASRSQRRRAGSSRPRTGLGQVGGPRRRARAGDAPESQASQAPIAACTAVVNQSVPIFCVTRGTRRSRASGRRSRCATCACRRPAAGRRRWRRVGRRRRRLGDPGRVGDAEDEGAALDEIVVGVGEHRRRPLITTTAMIMASPAAMGMSANVNRRIKAMSPLAPEREHGGQKTRRRQLDRDRDRRQRHHEHAQKHIVVDRSETGTGPIEYRPARAGRARQENKQRRLQDGLQVEPEQEGLEPGRGGSTPSSIW